MAETREFPTEVIASISTGVLLCEFGEMHKAAEYLMGHPIWTHHLIDKDLRRDMLRAIAAQCPGMPTEIAGVTPDNFREKIAALHAELGPVQTIREGSGLTAMLPTDGIPDRLKGKTIVVETPRRPRRG